MDIVARNMVYPHFSLHRLRVDSENEQPNICLQLLGVQVSPVCLGLHTSAMTCCRITRVSSSKKLDSGSLM